MDPRVNMTFWRRGSSREWSHDRSVMQPGSLPASNLGSFRYVLCENIVLVFVSCWQQGLLVQCQMCSVLAATQTTPLLNADIVHHVSALRHPLSAFFTLFIESSIFFGVDFLQIQLLSARPSAVSLIRVFPQHRYQKRVRPSVCPRGRIRIPVFRFL